MNELLDRAGAHLDRGLRLRADRDPGAARQELLMASKLLFEAARHSGPPVRDTRTRQGERLLRMAEELPPSGSSGSNAVDNGRIPERDGEERAHPWIARERPRTRFSDVGGLDQVKDEIRLRFVLPFSHSDKARRYGLRPGGGLLLYGPPGTGKTLMARATAGELDASFFTVKPSEIMSKWVGEAEKNVEALFAEARRHSRSVIFIDEVEALLPKRRQTGSTVMARVVPQFLAELEGFDEHRSALLFLGATNEPWALDAAALRPGRFDLRIHVPLPDLPAREQVLYMHLRGLPLDPALEVRTLAGMTQGYSGSDLAAACRKAAEAPFMESIRSGADHPITEEDFRRALELVKPSVSPAEEARHERFTFSE